MRRLFLSLLLSLVVAGPAFAGSTLTKDEIRIAEKRLAELGYWAGPADGVWDGASRHALIAFQKVDGARPTGNLTRAEFNALTNTLKGVPVPRQKERAHIEVDLSRQILFLVDDEGKVANILPVSSGSGKRFHENGYPETLAVTPCGRLEVYSKASGWKTSPLGQMHNPMYIVGGIAIHGSEDVPPYPASHGCIRIPMYASNRLPGMIPVGTPVLVYGCQEEVASIP
ncbi:MAG TPA: L,D-transpeptidase family protein [Thermoanaerobaculia bacterium]|jgi:lipoprotein-anchoring transpeptidase ErfK/SrfK|nr:L,D-transpeptidase family protein [Thermoanaerobaculia bacterium]